MQRLACWALAAALAGCATPRPPTTPDELTGRLSVRVESNPPRNVNSAFELRGTPERGELVLTSPLGNMLAQARWQPGLAELRTSDATQRFADLDALAYEVLGEALPLAALFDWLRGRPWPGAPAQRATDGFDQLGWRVDLARYGEGWVIARRDKPPTVTVRARLEAPTP